MDGGGPRRRTARIPRLIHELDARTVDNGRHRDRGPLSAPRVKLDSGCSVRRSLANNAIGRLRWHSRIVSDLIQCRLRPIIFHPKAREVIRKFPKDVRARLGKGLYRLQMGEDLGMPNSRPMPAVGAAVSELRVKNADGSFRAFYYVASAKGVLVFHAFAKKTQRTPPLELDLARKRLKELLDA